MINKIFVIFRYVAQTNSVLFGWNIGMKLKTAFQAEFTAYENGMHIDGHQKINLQILSAFIVCYNPFMFASAAAAAAAVVAVQS